MSNFYAATSLTGGGVNALDAIDGEDLANGDGAFVLTDGAFYSYHLNATLGGDEAPPRIIAPDTDPGNKRWTLAADFVALGPDIDVRAFGATGYGVIDDKVAIQEAINAAAVLGGTVCVPPGTYLISSSLVVPGNVKLKGSSLGTASTLLLSGNIIGIDIGNTAIGVIIKNICVTNSIKQGTGIYIHGNSRKVVLSGCHLYNLANGVMISGAWTINIQDMCYIKENTRGVNIYRRTDEGPTTTIDIIGNTIYNNDTYNISVGEYSQANGQVGLQCATLNIRDNMLDNKGNYIAGIYNLVFEGNHGESFGDKFVDFAYFLYNASIKNNYAYDGNYGFCFDGENIRYITLENNYFSTIAQYAIHFGDVAVYPIRIINNWYYLCAGKICYPYNTTTKRLADTIYMEADEYNSIVAGQIIETGTAAPATGRYKAGSIVKNKYPTAGGKAGWIFIASPWGMSQSTEDTDTVDADEPTNVVTPTDFSKYKQGDYLQIDGAGAGGANLLTVITDMDYVAETFEVSPAIVTTVVAANTTLIAGTWKTFGDITV